jgi:hypothetical protein
MGGLRVEKTRRDPAVSDNVAEQAKNLHAGLLSESSQNPASKTAKFLFNPSHIFLAPDMHKQAQRLFAVFPLSR